MRRITARPTYTVLTLVASSLLIVLVVNVSHASPQDDSCTNSVNASGEVVVTCTKDGAPPTTNESSPAAGPRRKTPAPGGDTTPARPPVIPFCKDGIQWALFTETGLAASSEAPCDDASEPTPDTTPHSEPPVVTVTPAQAAQLAVAELKLPTPTIHIGPDWTQNEWTMLAVGYPAWAWIDHEILAAHHTTTTVSGITIHITAQKPTLTIDFGDGTASTCQSAGTPWSYARWKNSPGHESPTCGHTWYHKGNYEVTATATWTVHWTGLGQSGTLTTKTTSESLVVPVGELESVLVSP